MSYSTNCFINRINVLSFFQICWWVLNLTQSPDAYKTIGIQRGAECGLDDDQDNSPVIVYQASEYVPVETYEVCFDNCHENETEVLPFG